ncbi:hypothetical protein MasN3_32570 [Massilia varians]|uniref:Uncharacterized protein n=1 Tax=Massilia varians TaxID=457921 RepID=A0ABM8C916_9BURK|nr:hypothetical protein MasN3_32570 [Massilia varians]
MDHGRIDIVEAVGIVTVAPRERIVAARERMFKAHMSRRYNAIQHLVETLAARELEQTLRPYAVVSGFQQPQ